MSDIGYIALFLAFIASLYTTIVYIAGAKMKRPELIASAKNGVIAVFGLMSVAVLAMVYSLVTHDFRVEYVAAYTDRSMSLNYLLSALWAGNDGSLLFWAWLLSIFGFVIVMQKRTIGRELAPFASSVVAFTQAFFLLLLLFVANPFNQLLFTPVDGQGMNPLLENPGMLFHPPFLLGGYVAFTIPFAFAIAALITGKLSDEWIVSSRRWTLLAWLFLGLGNLIGAWWAYVELGWGGYWAWDPVENASFMPWLVGTAFLHSVMMQRRRGMLKIWNMVLIILTFSLAILGTFLTRSGVISSVHTFAETPLLGALFLTFMGVALIGSLGLLYYRSDKLRSEAEMESLVSRESTFLLNNLLLVGAAFAILVGTFFPVISEAVRGVKISVGPPFFNQVNPPIFLAIVLLAGICTLIGWRQASFKNLMRHFLWPLIITLVVAIVLFALGIRQAYALIAYSVAAFVLMTIFSEWFRGTKARHRMVGENYFNAFFSLVKANRPRYGGYIVHISIILITIGITGSSLYDVEKEATLKPGDSIAIKNYTLTYQNIDRFETQNREVFSATLSVTNSGELLGDMIPQKYVHRNHQPVSEVAIRSTLKEDLYVILVGNEADGTAAFKVVVNPLVNWIWIGGVIMIAGGLIAFWPERRKESAQVNTGARRK